MNNEINFNKNRNKVFVVLGAICLVMVVGVSFALWQLTFTQSGTNVITTGCLQLKFTEDTDAINLTDATPTSDEEGKGFTPFTFTIENVCTTETSYVVNLETVSSGDKILTDNYIKANLTDGTNEVFSDKLLDSHENLEKVISEASKAYKLYQGKLGNKEKVSFNLRVWLDENTEAKDEVMEAIWQGKITVTATYVPPVNMKNVMVAMEEEEGLDPGTHQHFYINKTYARNMDYLYLDKVIFESKINPHSDAERIVDFSEAQDESVLGYYVQNESGNHTLYIQANGKIKVNPKASYYFLTSITPEMPDFETTFEGIENLDISKVTDMSYMFYKCADNEAISKIVSSIDTSLVTNMDFMFGGCYNLTTTITIRNKDVTYDCMFWDAATIEGSQITLNYTADTESVVDAMIASKPENSNVVKGALVS